MKAAEIILTKCMKVAKDEIVLIVTDTNKVSLAKQFLSCAAGIAKMAVMINMKPRKIDGEEPARNVAIAMKNANVVIILTTRSLSHTKARRDACKAGARIASMPGITDAILKRAIDIDYKKLAKINAKLSPLITKSKTVRITTSKGTNLSFSVKGRKCEPDSGIYAKKGSWGNLPAGEVYIAPVEGTANGTIVFDASFAGIGKLSSPLKFTVKNGFVSKIESRNAAKLKKQISGLGKSALNIAEFGIGTNEKAIVTGIVLEDEKASGTCHIAIGSNASFGGKTNAKCHLDGVIRNPIICADGKKIKH